MAELREFGGHLSGVQRRAAAGHRARLPARDRRVGGVQRLRAYARAAFQLCRVGQGMAAGRAAVPKPAQASSARERCPYTLAMFWGQDYG